MLERVDHSAMDKMVMYKTVMEMMVQMLGQEVMLQMLMYQRHQTPQYSGEEAAALIDDGKHLK